MSRSPVDSDALIELVGEDPDLLVSLVETFLEECPTYLETIRTAIEQQNAEALERGAHGLKGSVGNLRARPARDIAEQLENIGQAGGDFAKAHVLFQMLQHEIERLRGALIDLIRKFEGPNVPGESA